MQNDSKAQFVFTFMRDTALFLEIGDSSAITKDQKYGAAVSDFLENPCSRQKSAKTKDYSFVIIHASCIFVSCQQGDFDWKFQFWNALWE